MHLAFVRLTIFEGVANRFRRHFCEGPFYCIVIVRTEGVVCYVSDCLFDLPDAYGITEVWTSRLRHLLASCKAQRARCHLGVLNCSKAMKHLVFEKGPPKLNKSF